MEVKEKSDKIGLKLNVQKTKIMASSPITLWQIDRETMETVTDLIFWASKITADGDCSHEIKRRLLLGGKAMINLDSILKTRDIPLPTKVHLVKAYRKARTFTHYWLEWISTPPWDCWQYLLQLNSGCALLPISQEAWNKSLKLFCARNEARGSHWPPLCYSIFRVSKSPA